MSLTGKAKTNAKFLKNSCKDILCLSDLEVIFIHLFIFWDSPFLLWSRFRVWSTFSKVIISNLAITPSHGTFHVSLGQYKKHFFFSASGHVSMWVFWGCCAWAMWSTMLIYVKSLILRIFYFILSLLWHCPTFYSFNLPLILSMYFVQRSVLISL